MSSSPTPDFSQLAASYDELRPADEDSWQICDALVRELDLRGSRVLDVGCGTGALAAALEERAGARVWGVDATPEMIELARRRLRGRARLARAEQLPFKDGWFERAVMKMVAHLLDRPRAFPELRRILAAGGRLGIATVDPDAFDRSWLAPLFPSLPAVDRARFPSGDELTRELLAAGFSTVRIERLTGPASISRESALGKLRGRAFSTFQLINDEEYCAGLERAEAELPERVDYRRSWLITVAER